MEFEFDWINPSMVICRMSGVATVEGYAAFLRALSAQPQFRPGATVITDHTNVEVSALSAGEIEQIAKLRVQFTGATMARSAIVVGPDAPAKYGLARMFEAFAVSADNDSVRVFGTIEEAMAWLRGADSTAMPARRPDRPSL